MKICTSTYGTTVSEGCDDLMMTGELVGVCDGDNDAVVVGETTISRRLSFPSTTLAISFFQTEDE